MEKNLSREGECARNRVGPGGSPCGACKTCCDEALAKVAELEESDKALKMVVSMRLADLEVDIVRKELEQAEARVAELEAEAVVYAKQIKGLQDRVVASEPRVAELVESEEKAWQTVSKLRVELETVDRLRRQVAELEASMKFDLGDGINTVNIAGDPSLPRLIKAAWPSHVVGRPVLERAVEMIEGHPRLERKVFELEADRTKGLDMIRDRLDADPTTVSEAIEGLIQLYRMEFDERVAAESRVAELKAHADRIAQERDLIDSHRKRGEARVAELEADVVVYAEQIKGLQDRVVASEPRVAELVESEGKAWQTVSKLRVELETVDRLRRQVAELESKIDEHRAEWDTVLTLRDHLRQEHGRVVYAEMDGGTGPVEFAIDLLNAQGERLTELQAAQKLRPMDTAPGDGTKYLMCYRVFEMDGQRQNANGQFDIVGWIPDRDGETNSHG